MTTAQELEATKAQLEATTAQLEATEAQLHQLRELVAKETGDLVELADVEGLDDDSVFFAIRRLILKLPVHMHPCDVSEMVHENM